MSAAARNSVSSSWLTKRLWKMTLRRRRALGARLEHQPVRLAVTLLDVRMRGAEDDVDRVGMAREDRGQRVDDVLDALVGREQAEGQNHGLAVDAEAGSCSAGDGTSGMPCGMSRSCRAATPWTRGAASAPASLITTRRSESAMSSSITRRCCGFGVGQDRVQRRHDRHAQLAQQRQQVTAGLAAEDAVLVLHGDDVDGVDVQEVGRARVGVDVASAISKRTRAG